MAYLQVGEVNGSPVKIHYEDVGQGRPIVLIHGWPLSNEMWEYQVNELVPRGFRCISYDRRGFGKSSKPWTGYDYDTMTNDLKILMDELNLEDVVLVGFSMGGGEVVRYFGNHGGARVSKAVLIASVVPGLLQSEANPNGAPQSVFDGMLEKILEDRIAFLDAFGKTFFGVNIINRPVSRDLLDYYKMLASVASSLATQACMKAFSQTDFTNDLPKINVPTLIIHGDADKTVPIDATAKRATTMIPNNEFKIYEGAPHGLFYTDKEKLNQDLLNFMGA